MSIHERIPDTQPSMHRFYFYFVCVCNKLDLMRYFPLIYLDPSLQTESLSFFSNEIQIRRHPLVPVANAI